MYIQGSIEEITELENYATKSHGKLAILFDSLKRASEIMASLSNDELAELERESQNNPVLKSILDSDHMVSKENHISIDVPSYMPGYLTVSDVSDLLGISQQIVRKHCAAERIKAWRTLGNTGEWRIDVEQYKSHPLFGQILRKYSERNKAVSAFFATNENMVRQLNNAKERKGDLEYYNNDVDRFESLVDESDE